MDTLIIYDLSKIMTARFPRVLKQRQIDKNGSLSNDTNLVHGNFDR